MFDKQMELGIENAAVCPSVLRREQRVKRARWWFDRMRQVVEQAVDRRPAPEPHPEQIWFSGADRVIGAASPQTTLTGSQEREICE